MKVINDSESLIGTLYKVIIDYPYKWTMKNFEPHKAHRNIGFHIETYVFFYCVLCDYVVPFYAVYMRIVTKLYIQLLHPSLHSGWQKNSEIQLFHFRYRIIASPCCQSHIGQRRIKAGRGGHTWSIGNKYIGTFVQLVPLIQCRSFGIKVMRSLICIKF